MCFGRSCGAPSPGGASALCAAQQDGLCVSASEACASEDSLGKAQSSFLFGGIVSGNQACCPLNASDLRQR
eukprot:scaffold96075_cov31-Tisochrysis_lutea.AAC.2